MCTTPPCSSSPPVPHYLSLSTMPTLKSPAEPGSPPNFPPATAGVFPPIDQYRLQLYNYAIQAERLRFQNYGQFLPNAGYHPYNPRLALSMPLLHHLALQPEEPKPQHSYIGLIAMAILSSPENKLVLSDIYQYILDNYPYFRTRGPGWRNSIRHNLSLNDCFVKAGRSANGKGHYWAIHPANIDDFRKGDFRRRKAQRKVRKHMGLAVEDDGTDSPSPPPLTLTPPPSIWPPTPVFLQPFPSMASRKRQFDMASLLAPDDGDKECPQTKRPMLEEASQEEEDVDVVNGESNKEDLRTSVPSWLSPVFPVDPQVLARYYETMAAQHHARRLQALQQLQVRRQNEAESLSVTSVD
nr:PREDICTED: hepatocyte nuclear factor 3-gamma [Bemisia tabaci]